MNFFYLCEVMETMDKKILRNEAARSAVLFGAVSGAYIILSMVLDARAVLYILDLAKLVGLIMLMKHCMQSLQNRYEGVDTRSLRRYGTLIALYSAIITAAAAYVSYQHLFPDAVKAMWDEIYMQMGSSLDANTRAGLQWTEANFAPVVTISQFIWCLLYGWILSSILAPRVSPSDPFKQQ